VRLHRICSGFGHEPANVLKTSVTVGRKEKRTEQQKPSERNIYASREPCVSSYREDWNVDLFNFAGIHYFGAARRLFFRAVAGPQAASVS
jgi:hypothetical protein